MKQFFRLALAAALFLLASCTKTEKFADKLPAQGPGVYSGGTFYLKFGEYAIDLNGYAFPLPAGVAVRTDKEYDIFTPQGSGATIVKTSISDGDYNYQYQCTSL